jgi:hypothetical protein
LTATTTILLNWIIEEIDHKAGVVRALPVDDEKPDWPRQCVVAWPPRTQREETPTARPPTASSG